MAQAVEPTQGDQIRVVCHQDTRGGVSRDSKTSNSIVRLRKIPHSLIKLTSQAAGFGLMAPSAKRERKAMQQEKSTANFDMQSIGNGKRPSLAFIWCHNAKVCRRAMQQVMPLLSLALGGQVSERIYVRIREQISAGESKDMRPRQVCTPRAQRKKPNERLYTKLHNE